MQCFTSATFEPISVETATSSLCTNSTNQEHPPPQSSIVNPMLVSWLNNADIANVTKINAQHPPTTATTILRRRILTSSALSSVSSVVSFSTNSGTNLAALLESCSATFVF